MTNRACCNEECGWVGSDADCVHPKHHPSRLLCPNCYEVTEVDGGIKEFREGQWWVEELDALAKKSHGELGVVTHDFRRAVAVVHNLLRQVAQQPDYHEALQRLGTALGLPAGADITKACVPAIEALKREQVPPDNHKAGEFNGAVWCKINVSEQVKDGAIRDHLISLGWTPPGADKDSAAGAVPDGWKLVPVEPTDDMIRAGQDAENNEGILHLRPAWRYMLAAAPAAPMSAQPIYRDSTPTLHVGDSAFESWFPEYDPAGKGNKQRARDAYAAGMGDPLVIAAPGSGVEQDAARLDWLEAEAKASRTGVSFDYVKYVEDGQVLEKGYRFMRHHHIGEPCSGVREAIDRHMTKEVK